MALIKSLPHRLKKLFLEGFSVMDIAEPLLSFDDDRPAQDIRAHLERRGDHVAGVRRNGHVQGYALREELDGGSCGEASFVFNEICAIRGDFPRILSLASWPYQCRCTPTSFLPTCPTRW